MVRSWWHCRPQSCPDRRPLSTQSTQGSQRHRGNHGASRAGRYCHRDNRQRDHLRNEVRSECRDVYSWCDGGSGDNNRSDQHYAGRTRDRHSCNDHRSSAWCKFKELHYHHNPTVALECGPSDEHSFLSPPLYYEHRLSRFRRRSCGKRYRGSLFSLPLWIQLD